MGDLLGLIFIFLVVWGLVRFISNKHRAIVDHEPSSDRVALEKQKIATMTIDVPKIEVVGRG